MPRIAVIDCGTNTFHLLIADVTGQAMDVIHREKIVVKIGEGGISKGIITEAAAERAIKAITKFQQIISKETVDVVQALSTSAFRNASNSKEIINTIGDQTGIRIQIISGDEEAELIYLGVKQAYPMEQGKYLIMDIGGGSVEFIICSNRKLLWKESFEIGAQRLLDLFHAHDPISVEDVKNLNNYLRERLSSLQRAFKKYNPAVLVGSSGTFDTLSDIYKIRLQLNASVDNYEPALDVAYYLPILDEIIRKNHHERLAIPGMVAFRADMIVVSSCLIKFLIEELGIKEIAVSHYALKEGAIKKIMGMGPQFSHAFA